MPSQRSRSRIAGCGSGFVRESRWDIGFLFQFPAQIALGSGEFAGPQSESPESGQLGLPGGFEDLGAAVEQSVEFSLEVIVLLGEVLFSPVKIVLSLLFLDLRLARVAIAGQCRESVDVVGQPARPAGKPIELQQIPFERSQQVKFDQQVVEG